MKNGGDKLKKTKKDFQNSFCQYKENEKKTKI